MRFGIADYGCNVWDGALYDQEERLQSLKEIGYEGTERLVAQTEGEVLRKATLYRKMGMGFATVLGPTPELSIQWSAAMGCSYIWTHSQSRDFDAYCRQTNHLAGICESYELTVSVHNHMGAVVETQQQLEDFLKACPKSGIVFDTAHLAAMDGDPVEIVKKYADRLSVVHLKDWLLENKDAEQWHQRGRFCGLGKGNIGMDNLAVMKALTEIGYDGWVFVEHDTHLQDYRTDLKESREYLRTGGY